MATTPGGVAAVSARLWKLASQSVEVLAPSETRRLVLARVEDEWEAERVVAAVRSNGHLAVTRPDEGVRLEAWMRHTQPLTFGNRLSVCFAWSEHDRTGLPGVVELGAGGFGNAEHPATRLVLELLADRIAGGERVLDAGCGSGVLGLCALELGAASVVAADIEPQAIEATRRNAALNGMDSRIEASISSIAELDGTFDVVVANIGRAAIVELAPQLVRRVAPDGWLAVSGISPPQCSQVADFLRPLVELERHTCGEWSSVVLVHGAN
ncbi:MAG TPA: 50S ribosomal protein L11 methyltransferase [Ilumatobacteraceae bacterium]